MKQKINNSLTWNRKLHIHLGLFMLLFVWLFSLSGLLLNHGSKWKFASFWNERKEITTSFPVSVVAGTDSSEMLKTIMKELGISGEVTGVTLDTDSIDFRVSIPGHERNLHINFKKGTCTQKELIFNGWGKMKTLHTFNGFNKNNPDAPPNWAVTRIWQFTKDILAIGFILLCFTSWIMWYKIRDRYSWGWLFLLSGVAISVFFVFH
jgi:hypothetical protein